MPLRPGHPAEAGMLPGRVDRVRDLCSGWVKEGHTTALCVCVARRGVIVLHEAFGRLRPDEDAPPLARSSVFPLSSATKPITATLLMQLAEEGRVGLNRPAQEYLPELAGEHKHEILVHHLLTHTSGYPWGLEPAMIIHGAKRLEAGDIPPCPPERHPIAWEHNQILADAPLVARPGELMIYTNANYELLGEIVVRVSGRSLESLARERIFSPLDMRDSWYELPASEASRVVARPESAPLGAATGKHFPGLNSREMQEIPFAGMGAYGTALDLVRFDQAFLEGGGRGDSRILSAPSVASMTRNQIPGIPARMFEESFAEGSWGYGWTVESHVKWRRYCGSLWPIGGCSHAGMGGVFHWIDASQDLVGAYCEVTLEMGEDMTLLWNADLFHNAITAAIDD